MTQIGFYSGSFDPVTHGHMDVIERALHLVEGLIIGVGIHVGKAPMFSAAERVEILEREVGPLAQQYATDIKVVTFANLAVDAAREHAAGVIIRGLRDGTDFDYEMQMAGMNGEMAPKIQTVFVAASPSVRHIAANLVRQIALMQGNVAPFVSPDVAARLKQKAAAN